ncbi:M23 family metallopeptidase [Prauserella cavernicola]|uniref:M23 family metallopeptidase n=1 Tax=Prauserella cavernicola TaxID=2800127 RepID=A0A934QWT9_9PSEU|nr:M23 family metallopeptidase [Prauserella cavernicola]MBK1786749.1 M23 family metallopeptidase [Prauserella cavernicola]
MTVLPPARHVRHPVLAALTLLVSLVLTAVPAPVSTAQVVAAQTVTEPRFGWPLSPAPSVARPFDPPEQPYGPGHRGVDLAAAPGQDVLAAGAGYVVFAGRLAGRGVVSVEHDGGLRTTYEPLEPVVSAGDQVSQGQVVGTVVEGHADCPGAACLHWGVRRGEDYLNPLRLVASTTLRLKPWEGVVD